jgi:hypothetical protein
MQKTLHQDASFDLVGGGGFSVDTDKRDAVVAAFKVGPTALPALSFAK